MLKRAWLALCEFLIKIGLRESEFFFVFTRMKRKQSLSLWSGLRQYLNSGGTGSKRDPDQSSLKPVTTSGLGTGNSLSDESVEGRALPNPASHCPLNMTVNLESRR